MSKLKEIRALLGNPSQTEVGEALGCTQGNVGHYERGQMLPPDRAERLIEFAASRGLRLTLDQIYGRKPLPQPKASV
jgi:putative transcriptional regulator